MPSLATLFLPFPPETAERSHRSRPTSAAFLRSVVPALDLAFGLEAEVDLPDDLADLIARLQAGPLGRRWDVPSANVQRPETELAQAAA